MILAVLAALVPSTIAGAQRSLPVLPATSLSLPIERLSAWGLVHASVGQLPLTREYVRRLVEQASRGADSLDALASDASLPAPRRESAARVAAAARADVAQLALAAHLEPGSAPWPGFDAAPLEQADAELLAADARARPIPFNGLSGIDASVNPVADYRLGRQPLGRGTGFLTTTHWLSLGRAALLVEPRIGAGTGEGSTPSQVALQRLVLSANLGNASIVAGRDYLRWGQGVNGGLFVSSNPGPLDQVRLSTVRPVRLPWIFRRAGDVSATLLVATMGEDYEYPKSHLLAYKVTAMPARRLQIGASYFNISGGRGSPSIPLWKRAIESFALVNLFTNDTNLAFSNKLAGLEARYTLPWRGVQAYGEWDLDDFDWRRPRSSFWNHDAGALFGVFAPALAPLGADTHLEFHHTGARFYEHGEWYSGATLHRRVLGAALGPDANAGYLRLDWRRRPRRTFTLQLALEERSNDQYHEVSDTVHAPHIFRTATRPKERHARVSLQTTHAIAGDRLLVEAGGAYDRVTNFDFARAPALDQFLLRLAMVYRLR